MAELKVEVVKIDTIEVHPNADRMELAIVGGYQICTQIGQYQAGDLAVYIPVDSILTEKLEAHIFGPDANVKLHKHRVRAIKLRGAVSQGMLMTITSAANFGVKVIRNAPLKGMDLTEVLGITKYQPPVKHLPQNMQAKAKRHQHPSFTKYTSINHLKKYWHALKEGEPVYITEKIHGTNFRAGWVPFVPRTFWQKVKNIFGLSDSWEFVYGSHNVQLMDGNGKYAFKSNVYKTIVDTHKLKGKIPNGQVWYGEIFGAGIQKGYEYGMKDGAVDVAFFDIKDSVTQTYINFSDVCDIIQSKGEEVVPYTEGKYDSNKISTRLNSPTLVSYIDNETAPVEGFVVRPLRESDFYGGRLILKLLSDEYLLKKDGSDWK